MTLIEPARGWVSLRLGELWAHRDLLYFLVWRDVKVRYKQTLFGVLWALLQPLLAMAIFSVVFGRLAGLPSEGVPYPIYTLAALLPWQLFAHGVTNASASLVGSQNLIKKVYFPRLAIPVAAVLGGTVDFLVSFVILVAMMLYYGVEPTWAIAAVPLFSLMALMAALAVGVWFSALNVRYRDVRYAIPFLVQLWLFATPVAYSSTLVPESWRVLYGLNPMVGVVEGFRWALFGHGSGPGPALWVSVGVTAAVLVLGLFYFRRVERTFADVV